MKKMQSQFIHSFSSISVESMDIFVSADFNKAAKPEQYKISRGFRMS